MIWEYIRLIVKWSCGRFLLPKKTVPRWNDQTSKWQTVGGNRPSSHPLTHRCMFSRSTPQNVSLEIYQVWTWAVCLPDPLCRTSPICSQKKSLHSLQSQFFERQVIIQLSTTPTINIKLFTQPLREIPPAKKLQYLVGFRSCNIAIISPHSPSATSSLPACCGYCCWQREGNLPEFGSFRISFNKL